MEYNYIRDVNRNCFDVTIWGLSKDQIETLIKILEEMKKNE